MVDFFDYMPLGWCKRQSNYDVASYDFKSSFFRSYSNKTDAPSIGEYLGICQLPARPVLFTDSRKYYDCSYYCNVLTYNPTLVFVNHVREEEHKFICLIFDFKDAFEAIMTANDVEKYKYERGTWYSRRNFFTVLTEYYFEWLFYCLSSNNKKIKREFRLKYDELSYLISHYQFVKWIHKEIIRVQSLFLNLKSKRL